MVAKRMGADVVPNFEKMDVIAEIKRLTDGKGVDVAIKALGTQNTFENALRAPEERYPAWACILASFPERRAICGWSRF
jgi:threonine dehydrogenase-like Zn-dependent dehydrogenase